MEANFDSFLAAANFNEHLFTTSREQQSSNFTSADIGPKLDQLETHPSKKYLVELEDSRQLCLKLLAVYSYSHCPCPK